MHRVIECFVLGSLDGITILSESPEKEALRSFGNQKHLHGRWHAARADIRLALGFTLCHAIRPR